MSLTHIDSDRIVELSGDTTERSKLEARHLSECAECRLELQMTQAARRLGVAQMTGFDPQRVAVGAGTVPEHPGGLERRGGPEAIG